MSATFTYQGYDIFSDTSAELTTAAGASVFAQLAATGANSVELSPLLETATGTSNTVFEDPSSTQDDASLIAGIKAAQAAGLSVVLKPSIMGMDGTNSNALAPTNPNAFFASYQAQIVHLAQIAQQTGVTTLSIGNEMSGLTGAAYLPEWTSLIAAVRQVYSGTITYAAATNEASSVGFWSQVDLIGVNMYPPLSASESPTVANLVAAWNSVPTNSYWASVLDNQSPVSFLQSLASEYGKQVLITETGYQSITGTATDPGTVATASSIPNTQAQANAYQALAQVWGSETGSWFAGIEMLQGNVTNADPATSYSVLSKPAQAIVTELFQGNLPAPGLTIQGSTLAGTLDYSHSLGNDVIIGGQANQIIKAGSGNDTIFAGPSSLSPLKTTTITVTGFGDVVNGVGAEMAVLVNGAQVGSAVTYTSAADPSGYQTYTFTVANNVNIDSLDFELLNPGSSRGLHITNINVNGVTLSASAATNTSVPGTFTLYGGTPLSFNTTNEQNMFTGSGTANDTVYAGSGNDTIYGGAGNVTMVAGTGNDVFAGGSGKSTVVFSGKSSDYTIIWSGSTATVTDSVSGRDGTDTLTGIGYIQFADKTISLSALEPAVSASTAASGTINYVWTGTTGNLPYASVVTAYNAAGQIVGSSEYYASGALYSSTTIDSTGASATEQYTQAGIPVQLVVVNTDGSVQVETFDTSGKVSSDTLTNANGTTVRSDFGITGEPYVSDQLSYNAAGTLVSQIEYSSNGSIYASMEVLANGAVEQDQYSSGVLSQSVITSSASVETKTYSSGTLVTDLIRNSDGSKTLADYGITGKAYVSDYMVFNAAGAVTEHIEYLASGAIYSETELLSNGATEADSYTNGKISQSVITATTGVVEIKTYNTSGTLVSDLVKNTNGTQTLTNYGITGKAYVSDYMTFNAAGIVTSNTEYLASGAIYAESELLSNGSTEVDSYTNGKISQSVITATSGSVETKTYNATGALTTDQVRNTNGTKTLADYGITGKAYASDYMVFNASGVVTSNTEYLASGAIYATSELLSNGSTEADQYTNGVKSQAVITSTSGSVETKTYNTSGLLVTDLVRNTNGTKTLADYGITGKPYVSDYMIFNAAGVVTSNTEYLASGAIYATTELLSNGSTEVDSYTNGQMSQSVITSTGGSVETKTYNTSGLLVTDLVRNTNGTKTLADYGITGKPYVSDYMIFNAAGVVTSNTEYLASGAIYATTELLSNGSAEVDSYTNGRISQSVITATSGSVETKAYNSSGALVTDSVHNTNGTKTFAQYGITGKPYVSDDMVYNASGVITDLQEYAANGSLYAETKLLANGSVATNLYSAGQIIQQTVVNTDGTSQISSNQSGLALDSTGLATGARSLALYNSAGTETVAETIAADGSMQITALAHQLTLTAAAGNESFTSFGGDTFVSTGLAGQDTISKFITGTGAYADTIDIKAAGISSMQQLSLTQSGANVVIGVAANSNIILTNTTLSQLNAHNFAFG